MNMFPSMACRRASRQSGLTLIELMVAMVLGLLVAAGIITVFLSTSNSNRAQNQMASLQEGGRFAMTRLKNDMSMANGQYCANSGGNAHPSSGGPYIDGLRAPTVYAAGSSLTNALSDLTTKGDPYPDLDGMAGAYSLPAYLSMRGYDCTKNSCTPADPHDTVTAIPDGGKDVGKRVIGTSVLTMRYLDPSRGWAILPAGSATGSTMAQQADGSLQITLNPLTGEGEPPKDDFKSGDLAMLADCSNAQIFAASVASGVIKSSGTGTDTGQNFAQPNGPQGLAAPKLFDFNRDFLTVTYYVKVVDTGDGHTTGALIRRVNGVDNELVRGIERLDFKYGVLDANGNTRFLTAAQVDASTKDDCPSTVSTPASSTDPGCLWRDVKSIEVDLLMDGQVPLYTLTPEELAYTYATDGDTAPTAPDDHSIKPVDQGFVNQMIRREFTALISVRNFNP
jgi:type IV pilus assembly protein PilW